MSDFCWLLARLAFLAMFIGMVKPKFVIFWGDKAARTRKKVFAVYLSVIVLGTLLAIVTHPDGLAGGLAWFLGADIDDAQNMLRAKGLAD